MKKDLSFEEAMQRLEEIVSLLEAGELTLENSLKLFEEGASLSAVCSKKLDEAEQKIVKISSDSPKQKES